MGGGGGPYPGLNGFFFLCANVTKCAWSFFFLCANVTKCAWSEGFKTLGGMYLWVFGCCIYFHAKWEFIIDDSSLCCAPVMCVSDICQVPFHPCCFQEWHKVGPRQLCSVDPRGQHRCAREDGAHHQDLQHPCELTDLSPEGAVSRLTSALEG